MPRGKFPVNSLSMEKKNYAIEDFVLDQQFRKWVFDPDLETMDYWESFMEANPAKIHDMSKARQVLLHMAKVKHEVGTAELAGKWENIKSRVAEITPEDRAAKSVVLRTRTGLSHSVEPRGYHAPEKRRKRLLKMFAISMLLLSVGFAALWWLQEPGPPQVTETVIEWSEFEAEKGTKTVVSLHDGSKVTLNSGSSIRYYKNFEGERREVLLVGEALFEVASDTSKPFVVNAAGMETKALGTIFNVKAFEGRTAQVSLLEGSVEVTGEAGSDPIVLHPGEAVRNRPGQNGLRKGKFETEEVMAWTNKTLYFKNTPVRDVVEELENWYGVNIAFANNPPANLKITGKYYDQTLRNVLEGLSYAANFEYEMKEDKISLKFKP